MAKVARSFLKVKLSELNLALTLPSGQCFRWKKRSQKSDLNNDIWVGVLGDRVFQLEQDVANSLVYYKVLNESMKSLATGDEPKLKKRKSSSSSDELLRDYFQLDTSLDSLYQKWSCDDELFQRVSKMFPGVRVMRQDPVENLFCFICSSCNNIKRITSMIDNLCLKYGKFLMSDEEFGPLHTFPTIECLSEPAVESELRTLGFGYRAKFIQMTAQQLLADETKLNDLRSITYESAHSALLKLPGIGAKVADCICLFSLDKCEAIPVDTHVYAIATRDYSSDLKSIKKAKSVTNKSYKVIGDFFRSKFGSHAGWAHSVLFAADLNMFKSIKKEVAAKS